MTTKEFKFRSAEFAKLDLAAFYFLEYSLSSIYRVVCITTDNDKLEFFSISPSLSTDDLLKYRYCKSLWFDSFDRSAFDVQLRYFKGFLNRLSEFQKSILSNSHNVDNLLKFCNEDCIQFT